jgi:hypothetical protein
MRSIASWIRGTKAILSEISFFNVDASPSFRQIHRSIKPAFDEHIYDERHHTENLFARLKPSAAK